MAKQFGSEVEKTATRAQRMLNEIDTIRAKRNRKIFWISAGLLTVAALLFALS